jgi:hypothetical protein
MSDEVEKRLRLARHELRPPGPETEERALRAALGELSEVRSAATPAGRKPYALLRGVPRLARQRGKPLLVAATALPVLVVGVAVWAFVLKGSPSSSVVALDGGSARFPSATLTDWVSYGDQVSIVSVAAEEELGRGSDGYLGRVVTLRIEKTIWQRRGAPSADGTVRVVTWGWAIDDGERRPVAAWGGPRLEVGARYVTPLVRAPRDGVAWTALADDSTLPLDGDVVTTAGVLGVPSLLAKDLRGKSVEELATMLARTPPDPIAAKYFDVPPDERVQAVLRERAETG